MTLKELRKYTMHRSCMDCVFHWPPHGLISQCLFGVANGDNVCIEDWNMRQITAALKKLDNKKS